MESCWLEENLLLSALWFALFVYLGGKSPDKSRNYFPILSLSFALPSSMNIHRALSIKHLQGMNANGFSAMNTNPDNEIAQTTARLTFLAILYFVNTYTHAHPPNKQRNRGLDRRETRQNSHMADDRIISLLLNQSNRVDIQQKHNSKF